MARMKRLQFMIEPELDGALEAAALRQRVSKGELIRRAIRAGIESFPPLEDDPLWGMVGADEGPGLRPGETIDDAVYGERAHDRP